jgi:hypothetical protein
MKGEPSGLALWRKKSGLALWRKKEYNKRHRIRFS